MIKRAVYRTGDVARLCGVCTRTVSKWIDSGKLDGYRLPESKDRRVSHRALIAFLDANGMGALAQTLDYGDEDD